MTTDDATVALMNGARWAAVTTAAQFGLQIFLIVVLSRLLGPADFGVMSGCLVVTMLIQTITVTGLGPLLVQQRELSQEQIAGAHWLAVLTGVGAAATVYLAAHHIAAVFRIQQMVDALRLLALALLLQGFAIVAEHLLQREMRFKSLSLCELCGFAANAIVAVLLAIGGLGYWALVIGYFAQIGTKSALFILSRPHAKSFSLSRHVLDLGHRGFGFSLARLFNFVGSNIDNLLVGRLMGADSLGAYARAYQLMAFPAQTYGAIADRAVFPYMARLQEQPSALREAHLVALRSCASVALPLTVLFVLSAQAIIGLMLGPQWDAAVAPFTALAVVMYPRVTQKISATVLRAAGVTYRHAALQAVYAILVTVGAYVGSFYSLSMVAIAVAAAIAVHSLLLTMASSSFSGADARSILFAHRTGLAHCAVLTVVLWPISYLLGGTGPTGTLLLLGALGAMTSLLMARIWPRAFVDVSWPVIGKWRLETPVGLAIDGVADDTSSALLIRKTKG